MRARTVIPAAAMGLAAFLATAAPASASTPAVHLARIVYNAPGRDTTSNVNGEYVKITNSGRSAVDLKGWTVRDKNRHVYTFPTYWLHAGKSVWLHSGKGRDSGSTLHWGSGWHIWNNTGDTATLRDNHGRTHDTCAWTHPGTGATNC